MEHPRMLCIWEAQFGDFANGAQVIIDQFITSGESKWQRISALVMLLPHGYEGQGPEHSSARLERFLQACAEDNIQVCNLTTPSQYFHALRRQMKQHCRKPLIIMAPKSLLRHKACVSPNSTFISGHFLEIIDDPLDPKKTDRIIFCSGKVYYELDARRRQHDIEHVAIIRIEQFYPFNQTRIEALLEKYHFANCKSIVWCQEEPQNMGGWSFVSPIIKESIGTARLKYSGRKAAASTAVGSLAIHKVEQDNLVKNAFHV